MIDLEIRDSLLSQLVEDDVLSSVQANDVFEEHERTGKAVRQTLLDMELVTEDQVLEVIAREFGVDIVTLQGVELTPEVIRSVPASVARMYNVIPVEGDAHAVTLATSELLGPDVIDELNFVLAVDLSFVVACQAEVVDFLDQYYGDSSESVADMLSALESDLEDEADLRALDEENEGSISLEEAAAKTPVIRFVNLVLYQAIQDRASDIHFEPFENEFKIRYRVDGALYEMAPPPKHLAGPVTTRVKVISALNIAERRLPQDGRIQLKIAGRPVDLRVSTLPTQHGESVVLRVLDRSVVQLELENLGMPNDVYENFGYDILKPNGILIVTGPTGCGKTTTLYSALRRINKLESKLITAEEPVEYDIDGIIQLPVNEAIGVTFARALRAFLRQDPDIIMVGEIRDLDTSQIAIQASLTGHLVFSTLHTNDAPGAVTRLIDMGVEPFLIASTLEGVLGQRLLRTICQNCREPYEPDEALLQSLKLTQDDVGDQPFYFGRGCKSCNKMGYVGRRGIYEYLRVSDPIRELINERRPSIVLRDKAVELGMRTLREDGIRCMLDGYTTAEEVLRYT
jgi:type IV pilus assembly protein PilB